MSHHPMPFGTALGSDGSTAFRLWAPAAGRVWLEILDDAAARSETEGEHRRIPMQSRPGGWHEARLQGAGAGTRYRYDVGRGLRVPDPVSRYNPGGVHAASQVVDPLAYSWRDAGWRGRPWHEAVVYELHVGTFTPEGSFAAAARRLPELADLGVTAVELMPVAAFSGTRGWGYDGVLLFAPTACYGTPDELKFFVDEAHAHGLMVLLDVVYNHFGPDGNYLHSYCPPFFNEARATPWGAAINFDGSGCTRPGSGPGDERSHETVRSFYTHNALYWVEEYHLDGLRLDAVHALRDESPRHIVCEIADALHEGPGQQRHVHLVLENEGNLARWLERGSDGQPQCATAQWNDDLHHAAHVVLTGETEGYYADFAEAAVGRLARALAQGFVYQGQPSAYRGGVPHGETSGHLPPSAFVCFLQNHDQVGNRALGERLSRLAEPALLEAVYACVLLSPQVPMLFMGEEHAASTPFLYFCEHADELGRAVAAGRRGEFAGFAAFRDAAARARIPDPNAAATFEACKLRWDEREQEPHSARLSLVRRLLSLRHRHLVPRLAAYQGGGRYLVDGDVLRVTWLLGDGAAWHVVANLGRNTLRSPSTPEGTVVHAQRVQAGDIWPPGAVMVKLRKPQAGVSPELAAAGAVHVDG